MGRNPKRALPCPNPLFEKLLKDWKDEATAKGSKLQYAYSKALSSLQKYPLPLQSGREAMILEGIGESIAKKLDDALADADPSEVHNLGDYAQTFHSSSTSSSTSSMCVSPLKKAPSGNRKQGSSAKATGSKEYIPVYRTGAYALLLTLYQDSKNANSRGFMCKKDLEREAQPLSDKSFTLPDPGSRYTAWSSMSTLIKKGLVIKTSNPAKYSITPNGCILADKLENVAASSDSSSSAVGFRLGSSTTSTSASASVSSVGFRVGCASTMSSSTMMTSTSSRSTVTIDDDDDSAPPYPSMSIDLSSEPSSVSLRYTGVKAKPNSLKQASDVMECDTENKSTSSSQSSIPEFVLKPGTFDIVLCVDFIETTGGAQRSRKDVLAKELTQNGVEFDVRKLQVGDFAWVARERARPVPGQLSLPERRELILDYIVERKRMDDLNSSIIDGRFREQKFRLKSCGLRHPVYLVEDFGSAQHLSLPESTLQQAIINTQVADGFYVKRTRNTKESVGYLTLMTRFLQSFYMSKTLIACPQDKLDPSGDFTSGDRVQLMTFQEFNRETVKNKVLTVREMFGKQLMQISGMSAEKAIALLDVYPTPKGLMEAFEKQHTIHHKERMLSSLKYGKTQRSFGPALSKVVYQLYCTQDWPS